jgi:hypothetical protein
MIHNASLDQDLEAKLRDIIRIKTNGDDWLTKRDEQEVLTIAVERLGIPLSRAQTIINSEASSGKLKLEKNGETVVSAMVDALAGPKRKLKKHYFNIVSQYYSKINNRIGSEAQAKVKKMMIQQGVQPGGEGLFSSTRWYRLINIDDSTSAN